MTKDEAIGTIQGVYFYLGIERIRELLMGVVDYIKEQPEIVRCKDCKHAVHDGEDYICAQFDDPVGDDFYCKEGERE